jgi:hypothetical protein
MSKVNEVSDVNQPRIVEQHTEQMPWGTLFTQLRKDGWNYAVMLVRKYNDCSPPDGLGDLAAELENKGYMTLIVVEPGENFDWSGDPEPCFEGIPCIGRWAYDLLTEEDIENRVTCCLSDLNNTRSKILPPYFNLSTPEIEAEFIADCFTDMYLKVSEMIYYKKNYKTPWFANDCRMWIRF